MNKCFELLRKAVNQMEEQRLAQEDFGRYPAKNEFQLEVEEYVKQETGEENIYPSHLREYSSGGEAKADKQVSTELDDIAWDIGLKNKWIENNEWAKESNRQKAYNLAKAELFHFAKGAEIKKGMFDGMNWIITGEAK